MLPRFGPSPKKRRVGAANEARILRLAPRGEVLLPGLPASCQIVGRAVFDKLARCFIVPEWLHRLQTGKRFFGDNDGHRVTETERLRIEKNAAAAAKSECK